MIYTLMHKNTAVADIEIDDAISVVARIHDVYDIRHLPVGVAVGDGAPDRKLLNDWWVGRSIPASRQGIQDALEALEISSPQLLIDKCLGLSLSDQYWVRPVKSNIVWDDINFFTNAFSGDVGNILFGGTVRAGGADLMSPDNTSDGWLRKKWIIADGKRCLMKGGSNPFRQEPLNEVLATAIMSRLGIPHVPYTVIFDGRENFSVCENFLTPQTELVSAWYIMRTLKRPNSTSSYQHFLACCDAIGISRAEDAMAQMLALDFLIVNEDRHLNNFGAVRNAKTLEWLGIAPIYDSGTSMWHDLPTNEIGIKGTDKSKPFRSTHKEQIKLANSLEFVDFSKLSDIEEVANDIYKKALFIEQERRERLCLAVSRRVQLLEQECVSHRRVSHRDMVPQTE
ncbi:MAG: HipA domain-containing protein [Clostridiales bacterium]|jgi:hypothetical protein|nr:HipA domain-containing protein [Clostridiales bacterium]